MKRFRLLYRVPIFMLGTLVSVLWFRLVSLFQDPSTIRHRYARRWAERMLSLLGIRFVQSGDMPTTPLGALIIANHRSPLDIVILLRSSGAFFLGHAAVQNWPVFGFASRAVGTVFVDREDRRSGARAIRKIRELLLSKQRVVIFPEGTTFGGDEVHRFRQGGLSSVLQTQASVVPVGLAFEPGTEFTEPSFLSYFLRVGSRARTNIAIAIGEPISIVPEKAEFAEICQRRVQDLVFEARHLHQTSFPPKNND